MLPQLYYHGGRLRPARTAFTAVSWNIEGLTEEKIETLQVYMMAMNVAIMSIQETHTCKSDYCVMSRGFLVILSGSLGDKHDSAGVGFVAAPTACPN